MSTLEQYAIQDRTEHNAKAAFDERTKELKQPIVTCPRCGRPLAKHLHHLVSEDGVMHTFACAHERCGAVISICIDFMQMHMNIAQSQAAGQLIANPNDLPGGLPPGLKLG